MAATAEKAQQEPHYPWFLTLLTAPFSLQSTDEGKLTSSRTSMFLSRFSSTFKVK